jgi:hypothetical protein
MIFTLKDIPQKELNHFIQLMEGYAGIWDSDRKWMADDYSQPVQITLFCYLISQGELFVEYQKLKSSNSEHEDLIQFMEGYFKNKCIVNFTDLLFLNEINQAFCGGIWDNVHVSWLAYRPEVLAELANYKIIRIEHAYQILVENNESDFEDMYFLKIDNEKTTLIDFFEGSILWRKKAFTIQDFRQEFNLGTKDYSIHLISMDDFFDYVMDIVQEEPEVGHLLN